MVPQVVVKRSDRGRMAGGGSCSYELHVDGTWIGWVGDERPWLGHRHGGRRWWACWRQEGDQAARWNSGESAGPRGFRTRTEAVRALVHAASGSAIN